MKTLIIYHFYNRRLYYDNLLFFLMNGVIQDFDYLILSSSKLNLDLKNDNITILFIENYFSDYGAYSNLINDYPQVLADYSSYIFINCTVRGPFVKDAEFWYKSILRDLEFDTNLYGLTVNFLPEKDYLNNYSEFSRYAIKKKNQYIHIQTQFFALNKTAFEFLLKKNFWIWNSDCYNRLYIIANFEIAMTQLMLENGFVIKHSLQKYPNPISLDAIMDPNFSSLNGDPNYKGAYFGNTITYKENPFIKVNRNLLGPIRLLILTIRFLKPSEYIISLKLINGGLVKIIFDYPILLLKSLKKVYKKFQ